MSNSNSCPTCGEHLPVKNDAEVGDIVTCKVCDAKAEILYIDPIETDYLDVDYGNAEQRGTV